MKALNSAAERTTQTLSTNGATTLAKSDDTERKKKFLRIAGVINKLRIVQGWNMISPKETEPVGQVWLEQLDRYNVSPELHELLLNKAVDYRL